MIGRRRTGRSRDEGAVLPLVLVMSIIGALIVLPLMSYAIAVLRANQVVTAKTQRMESVRAGARVALADPISLFNQCGNSWAVSLPAPPISEPVATSCHQVDEVGVIPDPEVPYGAVAVQVGETVQPTFSGDLLEPPAAAGDDWWDALDEPTPTENAIWLPHLPERVAFHPEVDGYEMPAAFDCTVFFPGTYDAPVVISDRTYFVSGNYYFLDTVTVVGGADAVVGFGLFEGCANDIEALLDMDENEAPAQTNWSGGGAVWVFGDDARLVIDNNLAVDAVGNLTANTADLPLRFHFNQRYVNDPANPGHRVSLMSVNGDIDAVAATPPQPGPLAVAGVITMPISTVQASSGLVSATDHGYEPSTLTAEPRPPEAPTGVVASPRHDAAAPPGNKGAVHLTWDVPDAHAEGGSTIARYVVVDVDVYDPLLADPTANGTVCDTDGATWCEVTGLPSGNEARFVVFAENGLGWSEPSAEATTTPVVGSPQVAVPSEPLNITFDEYDEAAQVSWDPPVDDGNATISSYTVTAYRAYTTLVDPLVELYEVAGTCTTSSFRGAVPDTTCVVSGLNLPPIDPMLGVHVGYRFAVSATNVVGDSPESAKSDPPHVAFIGAPAPIIVGPLTPTAAPYVPLPIVDVDASGAAATEIEFKGYISIPQGRVAVSNPLQHEVHLRGGVIAGSFDVDNATTFPSTTTVGFRNTVLQRTVAVVSTQDNLTSTITVQINESGEYAVNSWVIQ